MAFEGDTGESVADSSGALPIPGPRWLVGGLLLACAVHARSWSDTSRVGPGGQTCDYRICGKETVSRTGTGRDTAVSAGSLPRQLAHPPPRRLTEQPWSV